MSRDHMMRTTRQLITPFQASSPAGGHLLHDVRFSLHQDIRKIFGGNVFRIWNLPAPDPRPCHWATVALIRTGVASGILQLLHRTWQLVVHNAGDDVEGL
ncbi:hypothetical protein AVEN_164870-1 [Araneus ventricosus]|uniref:Uncharacterized protein n=1 Tax=Araneus ventricosus TaxID=182803 RepID=A0A4Y2ARG1_ARAVE|nr:hypothetical protein AVEN_164870-1 [Araneus ventricosus]